MLKQRVLTGSVLAALFLSLLFLAPKLLFLLFMGVVVGVSAWEWSNLCGVQAQMKRIGYAGAVLLGATAVWWSVYEAHWFSLQAMLTVAALWWAVALLWVQGYPSSAIIWQPVLMRLFMGILVLVPPLVAIYELRLQDGGEYLVLAVVVIVAAADIGAYFSGKSFGRRKLSPNVSPGKSWEGVAGGLLLVIAIVVVFSFLSGYISVISAMLIALPTAMVSVLGDLLESMLKRHRGVKDSSQLLPGHGGFLDRIDGLVAAIPVFTLGLSHWR